MSKCEKLCEYSSPYGKCVKPEGIPCPMEAEDEEKSE